MNHKPGKFKVKDLSLAKAGKLRIEWAESRMPCSWHCRKNIAKQNRFKATKLPDVCT